MNEDPKGAKGASSEQPHADDDSKAKRLAADKSAAEHGAEAYGGDPDTEPSLTQVEREEIEG